MTDTSDTFVPAWKRLGLKLKNGSDHTPILPADSTGTSETYERTNTKRSRTRNDNDAKQTKRARTESTTLSSLNRSNHDRIRQDVQTTEAPPGRKKAVSFSSDTKQADEGSADIVAGQLTTETVNVGHELQQDHATAVTTKKREKAKKPKNKADKSRSKGQESDDIEKPAFISYLEQFHTDRANWKFNKVKQIELFKHLLDTDRISLSHDPALASYIRGLQGQNLKGRLQEQAQATINTIKDDIASKLGTRDMSTVDARRDALTTIRDAELEKTGDADLEKIKKDAERQLALNERAGTVLMALGLSQQQEVAMSTVPLTTERKSTGPQPSAKRKRKSRTADVDESSGSESSSSSSSSSDESDDRNDSSDSDGSSDSDSDSDSASSSASSSAGSEDETREDKKR